MLCQFADEISKEDESTMTLDPTQNHDDSDDDNEDGEGAIQLGFLYKEHNPLFAASDWRNWDGGKVGGKPVWLDPVNLPSTEELACGSCKDPLVFLLQIYCPMDVVPEAFHRSIYVFCCKKKACIAAKKAIKTFRVQLSKDNDYYSSDPKMNSDFKKISNMPKLCALCGCRANNVCSGCKYVAYCSRAHQKLHWKSHKVYCKSGDVTHMSEQDGHYDDSQLSFLFPEYEMSVELEQDEKEEDDSEVEAVVSAPAEGTNVEQGKPMVVKTAATTKIWEDALTEGGEEDASDAALTQSDYNKALSEQKYDPVYVSFLTRIAKGGTKQVLRYCEQSVHNDEHSYEGNIPISARDKGRIFINQEFKKNAASIEVPSCPHCNAPRALEFQILPQILDYLEVDKNTQLIKTIEEKNVENGEAVDGKEPPQGDNPANKVTVKGIVKNQGEEDIEWGTIDVYTCSKNCCKEMYCEEAIVMQDLPIEELKLSKPPSQT